MCVCRSGVLDGCAGQGVVAKFQQQLAELLAIVESSETHFVRCIKPNILKQGAPNSGRRYHRPLTRLQGDLGHVPASLLTNDIAFPAPFLFTALAANLWEDGMVSKQLRCSGIMEAVRVIAAGYPDRVPHSEILGRFAALIQLDQRPSADKAGEKAAASQVVLHSIAWMLHAGGKLRTRFSLAGAHVAEA